ncbi:MAG: heme ABC transporter permease [Alphaproteobacteria bacterium]|nr:heme ABC transporter permease [Alphaproteobacteria bacterium]
MHFMYNPKYVLKLCDKIYPYSLGLSLVTFILGLYGALIISPPDYQQGEAVRLMYIHVPAAWLSIFVYCFIACAGAAFLIWRYSLSPLIIQAAAPLGTVYTLLALFSGAFWGKPMWGTWWVWDARLTSFLFLLFIYLGLIFLSKAFNNQERAAKSLSILAVVGAINVPIIKFSVDWWHTLHQPSSILRWGGPSIDPAMIWPLLTMILAFTFFFFTTLILGLKTKILKRKIENYQDHQYE